MKLSPRQKAIPEKKMKAPGEEKAEDDPPHNEQKGTGAEMICMLVPVSSHLVAEFQDPPKRRGVMLWLE